MRDNFKIAWRNLWRNRRRTIITSASVFFAVFFAVIMRSYQLGTYDQVITNLIESFSGYIQVQHIEYQDNPLIDNSFEYDEVLSEKISDIDRVTSVTPHLESFALASSGPQTRGVAIVAIDPEKERNFTDPESKLVRYRINKEITEKYDRRDDIPESVKEKLKKNLDRSYSSRARLELEMGLTREESRLYLDDIMRSTAITNGYLSEHDDGVLVSDRLAGYLKAGIGDTVILIGQGYHGSSAAGIFPVRGIIKIPSPDIDNRLIIMTIPAAQKFFGSEGRITSLAINLTGKSKRILKNAKDQINSIIEDGNTVAKTWSELNPVLYQQIQGDNQSGAAMLGMLYFIIFFGIFGTVLMMIAERKREFGVMIAIGMQKKKLKGIITIEMALLGAIGVISGMIASAPVILYFYYFPVVLAGDLGKMMEDYGWDAVMPTAWFGPYFYWQAVIVAIMVSVATLYPRRKIGKLKEIEALRS